MGDYCYSGVVGHLVWIEVDIERCLWMARRVRDRSSWHALVFEIAMGII